MKNIDEIELYLVPELLFIYHSYYQTIVWVKIRKKLMVHYLENIYSRSEVYYCKWCQGNKHIKQSSVIRNELKSQNVKESRRLVTRALF